MKISIKITLNVDSFLRLINSILMIPANPFLNSHSLNFFQLESACSSSCHDASLGWEKGLVHLVFIFQQTTYQCLTPQQLCPPSLTSNSWWILGQHIQKRYWQTAGVSVHWFDATADKNMRIHLQNIPFVRVHVDQLLNINITQYNV